ncbi:Fpg/Nei family DNA glycosylase [Georgenia muralis]|uniref:DNA-(apurinic or apyrimidinic site) lyase n=1 Tax=Georgenia muralis TaxID=154117 RepID=A0A3N4Z394_9MICO|nr:zinc finger domain-containing protein [Georgenia muralis]RPF27749.1 endonuclease-8/formamidopyrimidine-DNA glycosylase [Georgenia muralis]
MPEGHTVHRLAHAFAELFGGHRLAVSSPQGRFADGAALLDGRALVGTEAHGKQLFLAFAGRGRLTAPGQHPPLAGPGERLPAAVPLAAAAVDQDAVEGEPRWLRVHLGLYGSWTFDGDGSFRAPHAIGAPRRRVAEEEVAVRPPGVPAASDGVWSPPAPRGAVRVRLLGEHGVADLTGPTACEVVTAQEKAAVQARLGPDPLRADGDPEAFVRAVRATRRPVGELLMDQAVLAGVGNIYRAEALYRARLHPLRAGRDVPAPRLRAMWADLRELMADGVATGRIVTTRPEHRNHLGEAGDVAVVPDDDDRWYVYHRSGRPCLVCGAKVAEAEMAGRRVFWCPRCQRAPRA